MTSKISRIDLSQKEIKKRRTLGIDAVVSDAMFGMMFHDDTVTFFFKQYLKPQFVVFGGKT
jgi:hypothetical protein